jgi:hypothetical protein
MSSEFDKGSMKGTGKAVEIILRWKMSVWLNSKYGEFGDQVFEPKEDAGILAMKEYASEFSKWILKNKWKFIEDKCFWCQYIGSDTFATAELIEMFDSENEMNNSKS